MRSVLAQIGSQGRPPGESARSPNILVGDATHGQQYFAAHCASCHSAHTGTISGGVLFDSSQQIQHLAARIHTRAVMLKTMPPNNKTGMTEQERQKLGLWISQGALGN